jgi:hypothetical protein
MLPLHNSMGSAFVDAEVNWLLIPGLELNSLTMMCFPMPLHAQWCLCPCL